MAQKKFSRLSIMLEARDKMSGPMMRAAKASQNLQNSVKSLDGTMSKTGQGTSALTQKVRSATNSLAQMSKTLYKVASDSALAYVAGKVLNKTLTVISNTAYYTAYGIGQLSTKMYQFIKNSTAFKLIANSLNSVKDALKQVNLNMMYAIKNSNLFIEMKMAVEGVRQKVAGLVIGTKMWTQLLPNIIKGTQTFKLLDSAIMGAKKKTVELATAFTLWKNSSVFLQKVGNDINNVKKGINFLGNSVKKVIPSFDKLKLNIQNMNRNLKQTGGRRATFNQLADANARLNKEIARMNRELTKANSRLGQMKSNLGSLNHMGAAFGTAYAAQAAYGTGQRVVESTVGTAMEQQYSQASVGILAGKENGEKFYKQIQNYAASTAYSPEDWARNMRGAISKSKSVEDLEKYQTVIEQLATLDPVQGLDGAALAVRELNSGDIVSLVERFELPRSAVKSIKDITDPIQQVQALSKLIGEQTGYTVENIQEMKKLPLMQWQKLTNSAKTMMGYIGAGALEKISPILEKVNKAWDEGKFEPLIKKMSTGFANITENAINFVTNLGSNMSSLKAKWQPALDLVQNIKNSLIEAWPTISAILDDARQIFNNFAGEINSVWPTVNTVFQKVLEIIKGITGWVVNNWPTVVSIVMGLVGAFAAFKVIGLITTLWSGITKVITLFRAGTLLATAAQWAMNTALLANPLGLVIALVAGLAIGLYTAYQKSETFRNAVQTAFNWLKEKGTSALDYATERLNALRDGFKSVMEWVQKAWDKVVGFFDTLMNTKINWDGFLPGGKPFIEAGSGQVLGHKSGLNYVPYDGYQARLHKGERVLTKQEAKNADKRNSVLISGNTFIVRQESDIDSIADALYRKLNENKVAMG